MLNSLPSAKASITHADDLRRIVYATRIISRFFPYMQDLLCALCLMLCYLGFMFRSYTFASNELTKQPAQKNFARSFMDAVFAQSSNIGRPCLILTEKLRTAVKVYGERGMSIAENRTWSADSVTVIYFVLMTGFHLQHRCQTR
jgi:hypothetical protein